jgi:hypothetical protein
VDLRIHDHAPVGLRQSGLRTLRCYRRAGGEGGVEEIAS